MSRIERHTSDSQELPFVDGIRTNILLIFINITRTVVTSKVNRFMKLSMMVTIEKKEHQGSLRHDTQPDGVRHDTQPDDDAPLPGVVYSCRSPLHRICEEADQSPERSWQDVADFIEAHPEEAAREAITREGIIMLTPLAVCVQQAPLSIIQQLVELAPQALDIADKYGGLPLHRCALENRSDHVDEVVNYMLSHDPTNHLAKKDKWGRTPLVCALQSERGPMNVACIRMLCPGATNIKNKRGLVPVEIVKRLEDVSEEQKEELLAVLKDYEGGM